MSAHASPDAIKLEPQALAELAHLRYSNDTKPGFTRRKAEVEGGFHFFDLHGQRITDEDEIQRIRSLAIPPAYTDVWICPQQNGHLQATGRDAKGRKQYRYHPKWRETADANKYSRVMAFAAALPGIRKRVDADLARPGLPREKVLATVVKLLETTLIRVGNEEYARDQQALRPDDDAQPARQGERGRTSSFRFAAKAASTTPSNCKTRVSPGSCTAARTCPATSFSSISTSEEKPHTIDSSDVNAYLQEISGQPFTAKDFRTWAGTVLAAMALQGIRVVRLGGGGEEKHRQRHRARRRTPGQHAERLPQVLRSPGHPGIVRGRDDARRVAQGAEDELTGSHLAQLKPEEAAVVGLLRERLKEETKAA